MKAIVIILVLACIVACGSQDPASSSSAASLPEGYFASAAPDGAQAITALKGTVAIGDEVVLHGRIGGRNPAFVPGRAAFVIYDDQQLNLHVSDCGSGCNSCSVSPADLLWATAVIQVVDEEGRVRSGSLNGQGGLASDVRVVLRGIVADNGDNGVLVVNASQIFVQDPQAPIPALACSGDMDDMDDDESSSFVLPGCSGADCGSSGGCGGH